MGEPAILHLRLAFHPPDPDRGLPGSGDRLRDFCAATSPNWDVDRQGAFLDLTGMGRLLGWGPDGPAEVCRRAVQEFEILSGGVGPTLLCARLASLLTQRLGTRGVWVVPAGNASNFLANFPVAVLEDHAAQAGRLRELGIRTLGDLQVVPRPLLRAVFGPLADIMAAEAAGLAPVPFREPGLAQTRSVLVAGVRLARPLTSAAGQAALLEGLALRALAVFPGGPAACISWQMRSRLAGGGQQQSTARSGGTATLAGWRGLLRHLWGRLPVFRQGLVQLELLSFPRPDQECTQGLLFPAEERARRLAIALGRINILGGGEVRPASEQLLSCWGSRWYGPDRSSSPTKPGSPKVDAWLAER